ncbi:MAG: cellulase family glycosylhydrolase [Chloroflexota bacterium]
MNRSCIISASAVLLLLLNIGMEAHSTNAYPRRLQLYGSATHFMWHSLAEAQGEINMLRDAGVTVARFDLNWSSIEVKKGSYQYLDKLDAILSLLDAAGIKPVITVGETPEWARPPDTSGYNPPTDMSDYANFMGMLAGRYANRPGMIWEIWNEPSHSDFWKPSPNPALYTEMLKRAYVAIHAADPDAIVLGGSIHRNYPEFLSAMLDVGAGPYMDALAVHGYSQERGPANTSLQDSYVRSFTELHAILEQRGFPKPIYLTEFGWAVPGPPNKAYTLTEEQRAQFLRDAVDTARKYPYVAGIMVYTTDRYRTDGYGLWPNGVPSSAWLAYSDAMKTATTTADPRPSVDRQPGSRSQLLLGPVEKSIISARQLIH